MTYTVHTYLAAGRDLNPGSQDGAVIITHLSTAIPFFFASWNPVGSSVEQQDSKVILPICAPKNPWKKKTRYMHHKKPLRMVGFGGPMVYTKNFTPKE